MVEVPIQLAQFNSFTGLHIILPQWWLVLQGGVKFALGMWAVTHLTVQRTVVTGGGGAVSGALKSELPYTAKKEQQQAQQ